MKITITCSRDPGSVEPGDIVTTGYPDLRPLVVTEARRLMSAAEGVRRVELFGRPPGMAEGRRHRLVFGRGEDVLVLPDRGVAEAIWLNVLHHINLTHPAHAEESPAGRRGARGKRETIAGRLQGRHLADRAASGSAGPSLG